MAIVVVVVVVVIVVVVVQYVYIYIYIYQYKLYCSNLQVIQYSNCGLCRSGHNIMTGANHWNYSLMFWSYFMVFWYQWWQCPPLESVRELYNNMAVT